VAELLHDYQHIISELRVVTGSKGVFDVTVDGAMLFSKHAEHRFPDDGEVLRLFRERYAAGLDVYPRDPD
jgi:selenoprotein W-related protein